MPHYDSQPFSKLAILNCCFDWSKFLILRGFISQVTAKDSCIIACLIPTPLEVVGLGRHAVRVAVRLAVRLLLELLVSQLKRVDVRVF